MGFNIPFPSPLKLPVPRRFIILGLSATILFLVLHTFVPSALPPVLIPNHPDTEPDASYFSPSKWLPPLFNPDLPDRPLEFDEDGQCLFVSPFDALSAAEKARAELLILDEVSSGIVRASPIPAMVGKNASDTDEGIVYRTLRDEDRRRELRSATHPILGLLREGQKKWDHILARQSKTIEEAYDVYVGKWGRPPPLGFDHW